VWFDRLTALWFIRADGIEEGIVPHRFFEIAATIPFPQNFH
jgi:hypothetical protein